MKTSKILLTTLIGVLISFSNAFSQRKKFPDVVYVAITGYVIVKKDDTVKCEFRTGIFGQLRYKPINSNMSFTPVTPDDIKVYYRSDDSSIYEAVTADEHLFNIDYLKRLKKGKISLYQKDVTNNGGTASISGFPIGVAIRTTTHYYYINKDDGPLKEIKLKKKSHREYFLNLISDDAELAEKFKNEEDFSIETLTSYIRSYNDYKLTTAKK